MKIEVRPGHHVGVDLDRTLAQYEVGDWKEKGSMWIGPPIEKMCNIVKGWIAEGIDVRIFTARVHPDGFYDKEAIEEMTRKIHAWCFLHLGKILPVTCCKHPKMDFLFDDRAFQVLPNEGVIVQHKPEPKYLYESGMLCGDIR